MPKMTFILKDGSRKEVEAPLGLSVLEIAPGGRKTLLCSWDVTAEQLRRSWKKGLMSAGYSLVLPWKNRPTSDKVRVVVEARDEANRPLTDLKLEGKVSSPGGPQDGRPPIELKPVSCRSSGKARSCCRVNGENSFP
jgi:hypothetical protein